MENKSALIYLNLFFLFLAIATNQFGLLKSRPVVYILFVLWVAWLGITDAILTSLLLFKPLFPDWVQNQSSHLAYSVWITIQQLFEKLNDAHLTITGDELPPGESAIVVANHVSWTDFYLVQHLAAKSGMLGRCRWFAKKELEYVPFLGAALWAMGFPMLSRNWAKDQGEMDRVFNGIVNRGWPTWLISFSEGTRFTKKKYEETKVFCATHNHPLPQHLLYPRSKGFISTVQHLRQAKHVAAVYDMTLAYEKDGVFHHAPTFADSIKHGGLSTRHGYKFHVHVRRFEMKELPEDEAGLKGWLERVWIEKGEWLEGKRGEWAREREGVVKGTCDGK